MLPSVNVDERTLEGGGGLFGLLQNLFGRLFDSPGVGDGVVGSLFSTLAHWWSLYSLFALSLSLLFFIGFIYAKIRYSELSDIEQQMLREAESTWAANSTEVRTGNSRWAEIIKHSSDDDPNAWRIAIIEADILLEETLTNAGYVGATTGDKLKTANPSSFTTIEDAWEAHKVRNEIAHSGSDFVLTKRTAQETIVRFERVFKEFNVI